MTQEVPAEIKLGIEAEKFLTTDLGKYLVSRAEEKRDAAVEQLKVADPTDAKAIRELQNEIWLAETFQYWIAEAIQAGWQREEQLNQGE